MKMICEVSKASAEVSWYCGAGELPEVGRYEQIMDGRKRILIIKGLKMEDAGEYCCSLSPDIKTTAVLKLNGETSVCSSAYLPGRMWLLLSSSFVSVGMSSLS